MKNNILLKSEALASLNNDKWGISIGAFLIYMIITGAIGLIPVVGGLGQLILTGPFLVGYFYFFLRSFEFFGIVTSPFSFLFFLILFFFI